MIEKQITGISLSERHKSLNNLISTFDDRDFKPDLSSLSKNSQIDTLFVAGVASKLKQPSVICELLKIEDGLIVSKALKNNWFFDGVTCSDITNAEYFFENLFSLVSFTTRCKIITQLGIHLKDCNVADQFYVRIKESYGVKQAVKLLPVCSERLVKEELQIDLEIPNNKMIFLYKKYPDLVINYIEENLENGKYRLLEKIDPIIYLIIKRYTSTFVKVYNKLNSLTNYKWSPSASVLILENISLENISVENINLKVLCKTLSEIDFDKIVLNQFPDEKFFYFPTATYKMIKLRKPENAVEYFLTMFELKYKESFLKKKTNWIEFVKELPLEQRDEWAKNMIALTNSSEELKYVEYLESSAAINRLMALIQVQKDSCSRREVTLCMINSCKLNNCMSSLLNVLKFVAKRFRNDDLVTRGFLDRIFSAFDLNQLSTEHWDVINEMFNIQLVNYKIKGEYYAASTLKLMLTKKMMHLIKMNQEVDSIIDQLEEYRFDEHDLFSNDPDIINKYVKIKLEWWKSRLENADEEKSTEISKKCLILIKNWNDHYPKRIIDVMDYDWLIERINGNLSRNDRETYPYTTALFVMSDKTKKLYLKTILSRSCTVNVLNYALKYDPSAIDIKKFITMMIYKHSTQIKWIFHKVKVYLSNTLGDTVREAINVQLKSSENNSIGNLVANLMMFSNEDQYQSIVKTYFSTKTKIDPSDDDSKSNYIIMQPIVKILRHLNPPPSYDMIEWFAKDDYLKVVLAPMLSLSYRKSHVDTCKFIEILSDKAVSVNKHSIRLAFFHYETKDLLVFYKKASNQKHNSIRSVVFIKTFKLLDLTTQPHTVKAAWDIIKYYLETFDEKDANLFLYLTKLDAVPDNLKLDYCKIAWSTLKKLYASKLNVSEHMNTFLFSIIRFIDKLDNEFFSILVNDYAQHMAVDSTIVESLLEFCTCYIMMSVPDDVLILRINSVTETYKDYIRNNWNDLKSSSRGSVENFISNCCSKILNGECKSDPLIIANQLLSMLTSTLPSEAVFDLIINLKLTIAFMNVKDATIIAINFDSVYDARFQKLMKKFSFKVLDLLNEYVLKYGSEIVSMFHKAFNKFFTKLYSWKISQISLILCLIDNILTNNLTDRSKLLFVCYLMPSLITDAQENIDIYNSRTQQNAIKVIGRCDDLTVKLVMYTNLNLSSEFFGPNQF